MNKDEIRNNKRWSKSRAERQQRRQRGAHLYPKATYLGDFKAQIELVKNACDQINGAAAVKHVATGRNMDSFIPPVDTGSAVRACMKRISRHYGTRNKCFTVPGYRK